VSDSFTASRPEASSATLRTTEPEIIVPAPTPTSAPGMNGSLTTGAAVPASADLPSEPLARIEDKTSRIEEKLARSEDAMQRVVGRFEMASGRMNEVASQAELAAVRGEVSFIARRVRSVPGWTALIASSVLTAILTAAVIILLLRYFPGALAR
jgi:hypothetical protein